MKHTRRVGLVGVFGLLAAVLPGRAAAQELVDNGGFEAGSSGWSGGAVVADAPHSGAACLLVDDASATECMSASTSALLPVTHGRTYRVSVWVRTGSAGQSVLVSLNQHDGTGAWISGHNLDFVVAVGTVWTELHWTIRNFEPETASVRLNLYAVRWTAGCELTGRAWFDDVSLLEIADEAAAQGGWLRDEGPVRIWLSPVEQKVRRDSRPTATASTHPDILFEVAGNEFEPAQLVLSPDGDDTLTAATFTELSRVGGPVLPASALTVREVAYVEVTDPSDHAAMSGLLPDPLPVLAPPLALSAGVQQPLWLTVRVPAGTPSGEFTGRLTLQFAVAGTIEVPLRVRVWNFAVPAEHHIQTAYGASVGTIDRYHHLGGDGDLRRETYRLYLRDFAEHRMSPYDVAGDDGYGISFLGVNWPRSAVVPDPADPGGGNHVLQVLDETTDAAVSVAAEERIPIAPGTSYTLRWRARTDAARDYAVTLTQHRIDGTWISGHNIDSVRTGDGTWRSEEVAVDGASLTAETVEVRLVLWACPWTAAGEGTGTTWFDDLSLTTGGGANLVRNGDCEAADDPSTVTIGADFAAFDEAAAYALDELGFDSFRIDIPYFAWGSFEGHGGGTIDGHAWGMPEYELLFTRMLRTITEHLAARGWLGKAYAYWFDEPEADDYAFVREGMDLLARAEPRLRRLLTEEAGPELTGAVDIWTPIFDRFDPVWAAERQAAGDEVWWYVCTWPPAPYPNDFIDHPGIEHRIRPWMAWKYAVQGELYWSTTWWTTDGISPPEGQDPWTDPASYNPTGENWGNGDGRLVYPPRGHADGMTRVEGPTPSIRWELLREGYEDYEYLWLLRDAAGRLEADGRFPELAAQARELLALPDALVLSTSAFTDDPEALHEYRRRIAALLESAVEALGPIGPDADADGDGDADSDADADAGADADADGGADAEGGADADGGADGDADGGPDAAGDGGGSGGGDGGCGCRASGGSGGWVVLVLLGFAVVGSLRRRGRVPRAD